MASANTLMALVTAALLMISVYVGEMYIDRYRDVFGFEIEPC